MKDTLGSGKQGILVGVSFSAKQQDCLYDEIFASDWMCLTQSGEIFFVWNSQLVCQYIFDVQKVILKITRENVKVQNQRIEKKINKLQKMSVY